MKQYATPKPNFENCYNPFDVPPFDAIRSKPDVKFVWWSWHPCYPWWSKSCWSGETEEKAWEVLAKPMACKMKYYHNKLIREGDGSFTEVADLPCGLMDVWHKIARQILAESLTEGGKKK